MHRIEDNAKHHEDQKLKTKAHKFIGGTWQEYHKGIGESCAAILKASFVLLHLSLLFHDTQYYLLVITFVTIFTNLYEYTYIVPRRTDEHKS